MQVRYFDVNEQGCSVRCKLYCADAHDIRRVIVHCHGFGSHKDAKSGEKFAQRAVSKRRGTAVVGFDWPCHGEDARKNLTLADCDTYLGLVVSYVRQTFETDELYAYATSFGGYLMLKYLAEHENPFRKVALRCPAVHMRRSLVDAIMSADELNKLSHGKPVLVGFERKVKVDQRFLDDLAAFDVTAREYYDVAESIVVVHGTADEIVSFQAVKSFAEDNVIEFVPVEGADHRFRDPKKMDWAISRIIDFFEL